jgi:hypothetical protein
MRCGAPDVLLTIEVFLSPTLGDTSKTLVPTTNKLPNRHTLEDPGHLRLLETSRFKDKGVQISSIGGEFKSFQLSLHFL